LKQEASGILNWLLEGTSRWNHEGLKTPAVILNATDEYRGEMDVIGNFLKERCVEGKECTIRIRELYKAYADWCDDNKEHAVSERFFTMRLKEMSYEQGRTSEARFWVGLQMKNEK
jgi:putative DNA primase/helicase